MLKIGGVISKISLNFNGSNNIYHNFSANQMPLINVNKKNFVKPIKMLMFGGLFLKQLSPLRKQF